MKILKIAGIVLAVLIVLAIAIPFFILAAEIMASGRIARDLTNLVKAFLGHRAGGIGHA